MALYFTYFLRFIRALVNVVITYSFTAKYYSDVWIMAFYLFVRLHIYLSYFYFLTSGIVLLLTLHKSSFYRIYFPSFVYIPQSGNY